MRAGDGGGAVTLILAEKVTAPTGQLDHSPEIRPEKSLTVFVLISAFRTITTAQTACFCRCRSVDPSFFPMSARDSRM
jgi:hypothetical protein